MDGNEETKKSRNTLVEAARMEILTGVPKNTAFSRRALVIAMQNPKPQEPSQKAKEGIALRFGFLSGISQLLARRRESVRIPEKIRK
jgi:DNA-directed RNA polymerase subunit K/omega